MNAVQMTAAFLRALAVVQDVDLLSETLDLLGHSDA